MNLNDCYNFQDFRKPTKNVPKKDKNSPLKKLFKKYKKGIVPPIVIAIIKIFITVPSPGFNLRGNHRNNTITLTIKVDRPIPISIFLAKPSVRTVQGVTPYWDTTKILSPNPNMKSPIQRIVNVFIDGFKLFGLEELQETKGTELTRNIFKKDFKFKFKKFIKLSKLYIWSI